MQARPLSTSEGGTTVGTAASCVGHLRQEGERSNVRKVQQKPLRRMVMVCG